MTEQDRGAYTPQTDAPLAFDARLAHGGRASQMPVMLIVSALILVGLVAAMVMFYRSGVRGAGQPPVVVGAPVAETKTPAPLSGASASASSGLQIYKAEAAPPGEGKIATPAFVSPPEDLAKRPAPPIAVARLAPPPPAEAAAHLRTTQTSAAEGASAAPPPAAEKPHAEKPLVAATGDTTPAVLKPPKPAAKPASVKIAAIAAPASSALGGKHTLVQIGAFSSTAVADKGWRDAATLLPGQMEGKTKRIEPYAKNGQIFYRTFVSGFDSKDDADAFCASLKAAGKNCFVR